MFFGEKFALAHQLPFIGFKIIVAVKGISCLKEAVLSC